MRPRIGVPAGSTTEGHVLLCGGRIGGLCELMEAVRSTLRWFDRRFM